MILAIDSGNTNIKWGVHNNHKWLNVDVTPHFNYESLESAWKVIPPLSLIIVSNVAGSAIQKLLGDLLPIAPCQPIWVEAKKRQCGLINSYYDPGSLGSDRWASLIAVWNIYHEPCIVVTVGTAMTIDMISESGEFIGGKITPGLRLLNKALVADTCLPNADSGMYDSFSLSTENALFTGVIDLLVGAVERTHRSMRDKYQYKRIHCILSGGDSEVIFPYLDPDFVIIDNLVLKGLVNIAKTRL